jgi:hypothetical protein
VKQPHVQSRSSLSETSSEQGGVVRLTRRSAGQTRPPRGICSALRAPLRPFCADADADAG